MLLLLMSQTPEAPEVRECYVELSERLKPDAWDERKQKSEVSRWDEMIQNVSKQEDRGVALKRLENISRNFGFKMVICSAHFLSGS